jgi:hypothetical protein
MSHTRTRRPAPCIVEPLDTRTLLASPLINVANVAVRERDAGQVSYARVTVSLDRKATSDVQVRFATKSGTATAGQDFQAASGTLVIPKGTNSGSIRIKILGDTNVEGSEKFYVRLTSAVGATLPSKAPYSIVRIVDNDSQATSISDNTDKGSSGSQSASGNGLLAASFTTPSGVISLNQVVLIMSAFNGGIPSVQLWSDVAGQPGTALAEFTRTSVLSSTLSPTTFAIPGGRALSADTKYWIVLAADTGSFQWSNSNTNAGSGSGFTGEWANTFNPSSGWAVSKSLPLQMKVS